VILAIVSFFICENVVSVMIERIKFLSSLKHLSLFFLISSKERGSRSAGAVERGKVVKKLDSRFTNICRLIFIGIYYCITVDICRNVFRLNIRSRLIKRDIVENCEFESGRIVNFNC
jgi:hypothetical protein